MPTIVARPGEPGESEDPGGNALNPPVRASLPGYHPGLHAFAVALVVATYLLLILGGTVTSHGAGLAVPDWPTTFQQNMFLFPPSLWKGGVLWEHTHRLLGSLVGFLSIVLALWLWTTPTRRPWLRWLGTAALGLVIVQGVMGGLRVTENSMALAVVHGITGQVFLAVTVVIAAVTSRYWLERTSADGATTNKQWRSLQSLSLALLAVLMIQLVLGAALRHTGSGLAIPDFPSSYGRLIPPLSHDAIHAALTQRYADRAPDFQAWQVGLAFVHRVWALAVVALLLWAVGRVSRDARQEGRLVRPAAALLALVIAQLALGAGVIWTGRQAEITTAHQALGAALLATATLLALRVAVLGTGPQERQE